MKEKLEELKIKCSNCQSCKLYKNRTKVVFGVGNENAKLMFIGEGPGADEDRLGEPFVGRAGRLLDMAFQALNIKREEIYIANIVKCRPPGNRNPESDEIKACIGYVKEQINQIQPQVIVLLGSVALKAMLGNQYGITSSRGKWFEQENIRYMPTFHPAALLRDESKKIYLYQDLKEVLKEISTF